ncbi:MAG: FG-GAP repeat protein [Phycisphaerales bacterium]|nr:FG-GAP repeat protein [Phycisphaerales bacterium]
MRLNILVLVASLVLGLLLPTAPTRADEAAAPKGLEQSDWSSIRAAYEAHRHAVVADEATPGHYRARNPGQRWITTFDGRGFSKSPDAGPDRGGWTWGLDLISYGRSDAQQHITGTACIQTKGTRVEYVWNDALTEWYINDQCGFEHGYTLSDRPEGPSGADATNASAGGMLHFTLAVRGELLPRVSESGRDVAFTSAADSSTTLTYNNLKVFDADGVHLAASFQATTTTTGTHALRLTIDDTSARYPLTIDPIVQQAYIKVSKPNQALADAEDFFGSAVAVSGDTVVVGAISEASSATGVNGNQANNSAAGSGAAYVFVRSGATWTQQAYLKASNTGSGDAFGGSLAISGDTVVVGAFGEDSSATGVNGNQAGNTADASGAAYVFVRSGSTWTQQAYLKASNTGANDAFGFSVAISGDSVVVGAKQEDSSATGVNGANNNNNALDSGAAYVFVRTGTAWTQQAYFKAGLKRPT